MVVASLDRNAADAILDRLPDQQASAIRQAMVSLPEDEQEQQEAIRTFLDPQPVAQDLESSNSVPDQRDFHATSDESASVLAPLAYLDPRTIATCLQHERASTISALLRSMPGKQAAIVLESMESKKRIRILNNLAQGKRGHAPAVHAAARQLLNLCQLPTHVPAEHDTTKQEPLRDLLSALDDQQQGELLSDLAESNPLLASRLHC